MFEDRTPSPSTTKFCEHKKVTWNGQFLSSFCGEPSSFKKSFPYLNINLARLMKLWEIHQDISELVWEKFIGETLFLHVQNFAYMFYFHLFQQVWPLYPGIYPPSRRTALFSGDTWYFLLLVHSCCNWILISVKCLSWTHTLSNPCDTPVWIFERFIRIAKCMCSGQAF